MMSKDDLGDTQAQLHVAMQEQLRLRDALNAAMQRLSVVQEDVQRTIARELHDDIGQRFIAIKLAVNAARLEKNDDERAQILEEISDISDQAIHTLRDTSRLLNPPELETLGLEMALRMHMSTLFRFAQQHLQIAITDLPRHLEKNIALACFRIVQEALTNVIKHSNASEATVQIVHDALSDALQITIRDNGAGITADQVREIGVGMIGMRERAESLGGTLTVESRATGTTIHASLPM